MERGVLLRVPRAGSIPLLDGQRQRGQLVRLRGGSAQRGQRGNTGLEHHAELDQVGSQLLFITDKSEAQRIVRYAGVPADEHPRPLPRLQDIARGQHAHRFPQRAAPHSQQAGQFPFVGQPVPLLQPSVHDICDQRVRCLAGQRPVILRHGAASFPVSIVSQPTGARKHFPAFPPQIIRYIPSSLFFVCVIFPIFCFIIDLSYWKRL